ncbi:MAG: redox-sensitive bicupin YhaK (pirin superfamily) [Arenicella sp.]|jgi:redox-sensitive bicupin YhaK (pirin superfamily)
MINVYPYSSLGHADHGWLDARHHFSFASYHNNQRMNFGVLRVINDDVIQAGRGFATHAHDNMEIITYVRSGAITHKDSKGNEGRTEAGDVQVMSAGSGITHSEQNLESEDTTLYQIWIEPNQMNAAPQWDSHEFPKKSDKQGLSLLVSGDGNAPLMIRQDAYVYAGSLDKGQSIEQPIKHQAYVLVSNGEITLDDIVVKKGDGAEVTDQPMVVISAQSAAEVLVLDVPAA